MKKRENFYQILDSTLKRITDDEVLSAYIITDSNQQQIRIVNEFINYISALSAPRIIFSGLYQEYSFTSVYWRKPIQKAAAFLAVHQRTRHLFCQHKIIIPYTISPSILIIGGNHRIRFYNHLSNKMIVLLKDGEDLEMIQNEINLRNKHNLSYAPDLIDYGKNWLIEENISGRPINRYNNIDFIATVKTAAIEVHFKELIIPTLICMTKDEYISFLKGDIIRNINKSKKVNNYTDLKNEILIFIDIIFDKLNELDIISVPVSESHGDFQAANILADENLSFFVTDWESTNKRFSLYDEFVLHSNIRQNDNQFELIKQYSIKRSQLNITGYDSVIIAFLSKADDNLLYYILILEEFRFLTYNNLSNNYSAPAVSILNFISEYYLYNE